MSKTKRVRNDHDMKLKDYQNLVENLRIRLNVLNASVFLLEEKLTPDDLSIINYISRINSELENIRKMMIPNPVPVHNKN